MQHKLFRSMSPLAAEFAEELVNANFALAHAHQYTHPETGKNELYELWLRPGQAVEYHTHTNGSRYVNSACLHAEIALSKPREALSSRHDRRLRALTCSAQITLQDRKTVIVRMPGENLDARLHELDTSGLHIKRPWTQFPQHYITLLDPTEIGEAKRSQYRIQSLPAWAQEQLGLIQVRDEHP